METLSCGFFFSNTIPIFWLPKRVKLMSLAAHLWGEKFIQRDSP